jgi:hypothetical protein
MPTAGVDTRGYAVKQEAIRMSERVTDDTAESQAPAPPPLFDPDPEIVGHREGNRRETKRYRRDLVKFRAEVQAEQALSQATAITE